VTVQRDQRAILPTPTIWFWLADEGMQLIAFRKALIQMLETWDAPSA
jgi:hypothetical protein